ncbi:MAG TPA: SpoIIE family protein phosphatase [Dongiaceae bacterium]|nr:SpoIIE family protein phosphatase [Dongiaceae bacterium]
MKSLVVDDNAADRKILRYLLERHGWEVIEAVDGEEGLSMAAIHGPALIISDALMPKMDGFQFLRKVKIDPVLRSIPFIFYSSVYTGSRDEKLAMSLGADAFVVKPKEPEELWAQISTVLERGKTREVSINTGLLEEEEQYLNEYSHIVTMKIEEKIRALEQARFQLEQSERRFRNLFTSMRDVIFVSDLERTIIDANQPALREVFGYELDEVTGKNARFLYAEDDGYNLSGREIYNQKGYVQGKIIEVALRKKNGEIFSGEIFALKLLDEHGNPTGNIGVMRDISARKRADQALRESEERRCILQAELTCAAAVQAKLLPRSTPDLPGFEIAARCVPAHQVGGDFYDWQEMAPGILSVTLGDVMGNGMAAAMLMATVRAAVHAVTQQNRPAAALQLAERALRLDLDNSDSFVTIFHALLNVADRTLTYVDCGHGFVFLRRCDGKVEELLPRGLPLGIPVKECFQEGMLTFGRGDVLVLYSDGLIDARPELEFNSRILADQLRGAVSAQEMVDRLVALPALDGPPPDDLTVLVVYCKGNENDHTP